MANTQNVDRNLAHGSLYRLVRRLAWSRRKPDSHQSGEITLRGLVLPIGGLKEKSLAAMRAGITTVIIPKLNEKDLADVPQEAKQNGNSFPLKTWMKCWP